MGHWTPTGVEPRDYDDDDVRMTMFPSDAVCRLVTVDMRELYGAPRVGHDAMSSREGAPVDAVEVEQPQSDDILGGFEQ